jgi:hypothetical protein
MARLVALLFWVGSAVAAANVMDSARMLPADTAIMISVESVDGLKAAFKKTSYYEIYKDPGLQAVVGPAEKKIQEKIDQTLKELWRQRKAENPPKTLPWPQGRVTIGVFLSAQEVAAEGPRDPGPSGPAEARRAPARRGRELDMQLVAVADMGTAVDQAKTLAQQLAQSTAEDSGARRRQRIRGIEFQIFGADKARADVNDVFCFGFKDTWLVVGTSVPWVEAVVRQMDRDTDASLATQRAFQTGARGVGEGELFMFVNADPIRRVVRDLDPDKVKVDRIIGSLGLDNVTGVAASWQIAASRQENARYKVLFGVSGQRRGIPALLCPASAPLSPSERLQARDLVVCLVANYDLAKAYDQVAKMAMEAGAVDINFFAQTAMAATGQSEGQPPLNLREDVLAQVASPLTLTWRMSKPFTDSKNSRTLVTVGARNAEKLDTGLARIHRTFLAKSQPDLQRKMLEHTLYLLPPMPMPSPFLAQMGQADTERKQFAGTVAGGVFAFGQADAVEQVIRDAQATPADPLGSDPLFRYVKRFLPSEAGLYAYVNGQRYWEIFWTVLQTQARQAGRGDTQSRDAAAKDPDSDEEVPLPFDSLKDVIDLDKLPSFEAVKKYFGPTAAHVKEHADGIYFEEVDLRPPEGSD